MTDFKNLTAGLAWIPVIHLILESKNALMLLGTLQLALRHPKFKGPTADYARDLALALQRLISVTPELKELCEAGWDPEKDL